MPRYKLTIEYEGTAFVGWQRQDNGFSVQEALEDAADKMDPAGAPHRFFVAGRTDAGVHALGQVAHVDTEKDFPADNVRDALNFHVKPHRISVLAAERVDEEFHARFSATERAYLYRILNRRGPAAIERGRVWEIRPELDWKAMRDAAQVLLGRHDFTTFRASECQADSPIRTMDMIDIWKDGEEIRINVRARSFLHHQVRNIVGTLRLVGDGKWTRDDLKAALEAKDRRAGGPTAPACGLYLVEVRY